MEIPLCVVCCFSLAAFNICSLCLIFVNLINMYLGCFALGLSCLGSLGFLDLGDYFLPHFREVFSYYLLKDFLMVFLFVFFWDSYNSKLEHFMLSWRSQRLSSFLLIRLSFFLSDSFISTILSSISLILYSASVILLFVASRVFLISLLHYSLYIDSFLFLLGPC